MNIFEEASRSKLRFETAKGSITVEDLWDLPLTNGTQLSLDNLAKGLKRKLDDLSSESFVFLDTENAEKNTVSLQLEIVKYVINIKLEEYKAKEFALKKAAKREKIMNILADKAAASLQNLSEDELRKMLKDL